MIKNRIYHLVEKGSHGSKINLSPKLNMMNDICGQINLPLQGA